MNTNTIQTAATWLGALWVSLVFIEPLVILYQLLRELIRWIFS